MGRQKYSAEVCASADIYNIAREITSNTENETQYSFVLKYDMDRKDELLAVLDEMNAAIEYENDEDCEITVSLNQDQLELIESLYLIEWVGNKF